MHIKLFSIGKLNHTSLQTLSQFYLERAQAISRPLGVRSVDCREFMESRAQNLEQRRTAEGAALLAQVPATMRLICFDERGKTVSSGDFAKDLRLALDEGINSYGLVLGGPDGLDAAVRARANLVLSFGAMTFPHGLARVMVLEQLYRALTILTGHPYHREG